METDELAVIEEKWAQPFKAERGAEERVVAKATMGIQRQVGAINGEVAFEQATEQLITFASPRMRRAPKKSVMHDQQVCFCSEGEVNSGQTGIHGGGDAGDGAAVFDLQTVGRAVVSCHFGG